MTRYAAPDTLSPGKVAAAVVLPIVALIAVLVGGFMWHRRRQARRDAERRERISSYSQSATSPSTMYTHTGETPAPPLPTWDPTPVSYVDMQPESPKESGLDSISSSVLEPAGTPDPPAVPPTSEKRHRTRYKKGKRSTHSASTHQCPTPWLEDPYLQPEDSLLISRGQTDEQRWAHRSPRTLLDADYDVDTSIRRPAAHAPEADHTTGLGLTAPSGAMIDDAGEERDPYTFEHPVHLRPTSTSALGAHSRDEKIYAYLSKLQDPDNISDNRRGPARPSSAASWLSHGSEGFYDAHAQVEDP